MQTTLHALRRGIRRLWRFLPFWVRWPALVIVVLLTLGGCTLASFTQEPTRAEIWRTHAQSCGAIIAPHRPGYLLTTDLVNARQAEACFMRGYTHCQAVTLQYEVGGVDFGSRNTFVVEPPFGSLAGCAFADIAEGYLVSGNRASRSTHHCAGVVQLADGLHMLGCGDGEDIVVSVPTDTPPPGIPEATAVLGGSVFAFDQRFGANHCCYDNGWAYEGPYGPMWTGLYAGHIPNDYSLVPVDEHSLARVIGIINDGSAGGHEANWTMTQAKAMCESFLPSDATYQTSMYVYGGSVAAGIELRYTSVSLANTLPSSDFTNRDVKPAPPGTFYVYYGFRSGDPTETTISQCRIGTDERWTSI